MASLRLLIEDIPEEGLQFTRQVTREELFLEDDDPATVHEFTVSGMAQFSGQDVLVQGEFTGTLRLDCVRCLNQFDQPIHPSFEALYGPEEEARSSSGAKTTRGGDEEPDEELERHVVHDDRIELGLLLREQVILSVPMQPLCMLDCHGLCSQCGENLNIKACGCPPGDVRSPFSVLKNLVKSSGKSQASL
jgi:uncharacterized protein